ncbi:unnamed protein product [Phyllotreta striolata]|uniref:Uncharacterized protein n=1 Tax=Phyllotreta striolata TaxID=444603 RepID=A0A9N9XJ03_PHYSR|nr:unnamed protein product [Phyllotreta striolata]
MAEGTYEYECMRAELLGLERPDYDEFTKKQLETVQKVAEDEEADVEYIKEVDVESEAMGRVSGKFDELNNILKKTQFKINRIKASCGSVAGLLKNRLGTFSSQSSVDGDPADVEKTPKVEENTTNGEEKPVPTYKQEVSENGTPIRKSELAKALDKDLSSIDSMIAKAENAEISMAYQAKEMRKFMK